MSGKQNEQASASASSKAPVNYIPPVERLHFDVNCPIRRRIRRSAIIEALETHTEMMDWIMRLIRTSTLDDNAKLNNPAFSKLFSVSQGFRRRFNRYMAELGRPVARIKSELILSYPPTPNYSLAPASIPPTELHLDEQNVGRNYQLITLPASDHTRMSPEKQFHLHPGPLRCHPAMLHRAQVVREGEVSPAQGGIHFTLAERQSGLLVSMVHSFEATEAQKNNISIKKIDFSNIALPGPWVSLLLRLSDALHFFSIRWEVRAPGLRHSLIQGSSPDWIKNARRDLQPHRSTLRTLVLDPVATSTLEWEGGGPEFIGSFQKFRRLETLELEDRFLFTSTQTWRSYYARRVLMCRWKSFFNPNLKHFKLHVSIGPWKLIGPMLRKLAKHIGDQLQTLELTYTIPTTKEACLRKNNLEPRFMGFSLPPWTYPPAGQELTNLLIHKEGLLLNFPQLHSCLSTFTPEMPYVVILRFLCEAPSVKSVLQDAFAGSEEETDAELDFNDSHLESVLDEMPDQAAGEEAGEDADGGSDEDADEEDDDERDERRSASEPNITRSDQAPAGMRNDREPYE